jgi:hypothetical protein
MTICGEIEECGPRGRECLPDSAEDGGLAEGMTYSIYLFVCPFACPIYCLVSGREVESPETSISAWEFVLRMT